jgi:hypothetical protein
MNAKAGTARDASVLGRSQLHDSGAAVLNPKFTYLRRGVCERSVRGSMPGSPDLANQVVPFARNGEQFVADARGRPARGRRIPCSTPHVRCATAG